MKYLKTILECFPAVQWFNVFCDSAVTLHLTGRLAVTFLAFPMICTRMLCKLSRRVATVRVKLTCVHIAHSSLLEQGIDQQHVLI